VKMTAWIEGEYRYRLTRTWDEQGRRLLIIMLNPSVANERIDDPTLLRCIYFAKLWGFGGIIVVNAFALRSPSPEALKLHNDPIGPLCDTALMDAFDETQAYLFAWGNPPNDDLALRIEHVRRWAQMRAAERSVPVFCLGRTKHGHPKHPLARGVHRIPNDQQPIIIQH